MPFLPLMPFDRAVEIDMVINIGTALGGVWTCLERDVLALGDTAIPWWREYNRWRRNRR
jgi:hypothetical protein